jgi:hypothetical protein
MSEVECSVTEIQALRNRAAHIEERTAKEFVHLDLDTFEKLVRFIEQEGCPLKEGLRRAVRMGVEALLLERTEVPVPYSPPQIPGYFLQQSHGFAPEPAHFTAPMPQDLEDADEDAEPYSRIAPPGLA